MNDEVKQEIEHYINAQVTAAFLSYDEIVENLPEHFEESFDEPQEYTDEIAAECEALVRNAVDRLMKSQESWKTPTDNDRLEKAFGDLENQGIVARENWTCCQTCGNSEIGAEIEDAEQERPVIGYTFYHQQDTDSAVEGGGIMLAYGSLKEADELVVPKKIVETLSRHGLKVEWDGSTSQRIFLSDFEWRRRWTDN